MQNFSDMMAVMQPLGSLNAANASEFQAQMVHQLQAAPCKGLMVDFSRVESLDSAGLIALVSALKTARQLGKRFCLVSVPPAIRILFELTQLDRAFELVDAPAPLPMAA